MKKNFIKKLALVMALTVAATSVPATNAEAASTPKFRSKAANLTVGQTKNYGVTDGSRWSVKFKIGNTKIATIDWKQGDKKVAVTGEAEGTTTLRADFKAYKTKRTHTERIKVYVKAAEANLAIKGEDEAFLTAVNTPYALTAEGAENVTWSVDGEGATVAADGKFTATKAGEYTVTATAGTATATQKVTVKEVILKSAAQTAINELTLTVIGNTKSLVRSDFTVTNTTTNWVVPVEKAGIDGAEVVLTTFGSMADAQEYTVALDGVTKAFTATDGVVTDLAMESLTVTADFEEGINVMTLDKNGVVLGVYGIDDTLPVSCAVVPADTGYVTGGKLYLANVGDTAKVTATFHTGKYDEYGKEIGAIEKEFTITAVKDTVADNFAMTIMPTGIGAPAWSATNFVANNKIQLNNKTEDLRFDVFVKIKNSRGEISNYTKYYLASSNTNVFLVADNILTDSKTGVNIFGVNEGTAYLLVKDVETDAVIASLPVVVYAKSKATTINLNTSSFTVASGVSVSYPVLSVDVKDQFGIKMPLTHANLAVTCIGKPAGVTADTNALAAVSKSAITSNTVTFEIKNDELQKDLKTGLYTYKVTATVGNVVLYRTFTVNLVDAAAGNNKYMVNVDNKVVDTTVSATNPYTTLSVTASLDEYEKNAIVTEAVTLSSIRVERINNTPELIAYAVSGSPVAASHAAIASANLTKWLNNPGSKVTIDIADATTNAPKCDKILPAGTYKITLVSDNGKTAYQMFTIKDTNDTTAVRTNLNLDADGQLVSKHIQDGKAFKLSYMGVEVPVTDLAAINPAKDIKYKIVAGKINVISVDVWVTVPGTAKKILVTVPVGQTFTNTSSVEGNI